MNITFDRQAILSALQLSDSFFPIGGYAHSYGLETFVQKGLVEDEDALRRLVFVFLQQLGSADCIALRNVMELTKKSDLKGMVYIDRKLASMKVVREFHNASIRMGKSLLISAIDFHPAPLVENYLKLIGKKDAPGTYAVCLGIVAHTLEVESDTAAMILLHTTTVSILGAAVRLGMATHEQAQKIIHGLKPLLITVIVGSAEKTIEDMRQFSPLIDIMGLRHAYLHTRMFSS